MIRVHICTDCQDVLPTSAMSSIHESRTGHTLATVILHLRRRRGNQGPEFQWSSDWLSESDQPTAWMSA